MQLSQLKEEIRAVIRERSVKAIQKEYAKVISDMEQHLELYKKSKGTSEEKKHIAALKTLTVQKKKLQSELDNTVAGLYRNAELKVDEAEKTTGDKIQRLNDRIRVLRAKITAQKDAVKRNELQQTLKNALQSLSNVKKDHGIKSESVVAKDGKVLSNNNLIGYYEFDRNADSFWVDDVKKGKGQLSFDTKKEVEDYFKKNEKDALKHLGKLRRESVNELKTLPNGYFKIKKKYNTFAEYEKDAKIGDTILKYSKKSPSMRAWMQTGDLHPNAKQYLNKVHSIGTDGVNVTLFGKQTPSSIYPSQKKELAVLVLESITLPKGFEVGKVYSNPYANAFKPMNEGEGEDHEVSMAQGQLDDIIKNATELKSKVGENETNLPGWIQDHISQAQNFINQANTGFHKLDAE